MSVKLRLSAILGTGILLASCGDQGTNIPQDDIASETANIVGGAAVPVCAWPTTVHLVLAGSQMCTGTLVHPKLVTTAAHCVAGEAALGVSVGFGEFEDTKKRVVTERCVANPKYDESANEDFAFCVLKEAITDIPIAPVLMGCEVDILKKGQEVVLAGFGKIGQNTENPDRAKRAVFTTLQLVADGVFAIGGNGKSSCDGDSGGPAFVKLSDGSWRAFGITSGGDACGEASYYASITRAVPWIEEESGIDITPCHTADGKWSPSDQCGKFSKNLDRSTGTWANWCGETAELSGPGSTCGEPSTGVGGGSAGGKSGAGTGGTGGSAGANGGTAGKSTTGSAGNVASGGSVFDFQPTSAEDTGCSFALPGGSASKPRLLGPALLAFVLLRFRSRVYKWLGRRCS